MRITRAVLSWIVAVGVGLQLTACGAGLTDFADSTDDQGDLAVERGEVSLPLDVGDLPVLDGVELPVLDVVTGDPEIVDLDPIGDVDPDPVPLPTPEDTPLELIKMAGAKNVIKIKFRDGTNIRLRRENPRDRDSQLRPVDLDGRALTSDIAQEVMALVQDGAWARTHIPSEEDLDELRARTFKRSGGVHMPDLNLYFSLLLPKGMDPAEAIGKFKMLREVESARVMPDYYLPVAPDYSVYQGAQVVDFGAGNVYDLENDYQRYLEPAPLGVDAHYAWNTPGGDGSNVNIVNIESAFERGHPDLPDIIEDGILFEDADVDEKNINHGTATFGVMVGLDNGEGVKGIAHGARPYFLSRLTMGADANAAGYTAAIEWASDLDTVLVSHIVSRAARPGDVMVLEIQTNGPNFDAAVDDGQGLVPAEWHEDVWNAIRYATANGFVVVAAAGNGNEDLDDGIYNDFPDHPHNPFVVDEDGTRVNDSGAIIVGSAFSDWDINGFTGVIPRSRLESSTYGRRVDVQGWGERIVSAGSGFGDNGTLFDDGTGMTICKNYAGTSGATSILGGVTAALQGVVKANDLEVSYLSSKQMRELLIDTGTPQQGELSEHIGPLPDLRQAINSLLAGGPVELIIEEWDLYCAGVSEEIPPLYRPDFSHESGMVSGDVQLELRFGGGVYVEGSAIYYTFDGSEPNVECPGGPGCFSTAVWTYEDTLSGAVINLDESEFPVRIRAKTGIRNCYIQDNVQSETVELILAQQAFIGQPGFQIVEFDPENPCLSLNSTTSNSAFIRYTLDGSQPSNDGNIWELDENGNTVRGAASLIWTDCMTNPQSCGFDGDSQCFNLIGAETQVVFNADTGFDEVTLRAQTFLPLGYGLEVGGPEMCLVFPLGGSAYPCP